MKNDERTEVFRFRVSPDEVRMLREIADRDGVTGSDVIRIYIRRRYAEMKREAANANV